MKARRTITATSHRTRASRRLMAVWADAQAPLPEPPPDTAETPIAGDMRAALSPRSRDDADETSDCPPRGRE